LSLDVGAARKERRWAGEPDAARQPQSGRPVRGPLTQATRARTRSDSEPRPALDSSVREAEARLAALARACVRPVERFWTREVGAASLGCREGEAAAQPSKKAGQDRFVEVAPREKTRSRAAGDSLSLAKGARVQVLTIASEPTSHELSSMLRRCRH
jgi:hypothetical protein